MRSWVNAFLASVVLVAGLTGFSPIEPADSPTWISFDSFDYELESSVEVFIQVNEAFSDENSDDTGGGPATGETSNSLQVSSRMAAATRRSVASFKTAWEDPLGTDVNSVTNTTDWHWNGNCVVAPVYGYWQHDWYTPSGWWRVSHNFQNTFNCTQTTVSSFAHFANDAFCPGDGNRTHAYYDRNTVHGRYNGNATRSANSWVSGGCSGSLHKMDLLCGVASRDRNGLRQLNLDKPTGVDEWLHGSRWLTRARASWLPYH